MLSRVASISHRIWDWKEFKVIFDEQVRTSSRTSNGGVCIEIWNKTWKKLKIKLKLKIIVSIIREIISNNLPVRRLTILKNNYIINTWIDTWILRLIFDWLLISRNLFDHRFHRFQILKTRFRQTIENNSNTLVLYSARRIPRESSETNISQQVST